MLIVALKGHKRQSEKPLSQRERGGTISFKYRDGGALFRTVSSQRHSCCGTPLYIYTGTEGLREKTLLSFSLLHNDCRIVGFGKLPKL